MREALPSNCHLHLCSVAAVNVYLWMLRWGHARRILLSTVPRARPCLCQREVSSSGFKHESQQQSWVPDYSIHVVNIVSLFWLAESFSVLCSDWLREGSVQSVQCTGSVIHRQLKQKDETKLNILFYQKTVFRFKSELFKALNEDLIIKVHYEKHLKSRMSWWRKRYCCERRWIDAKSNSTIPVQSNMSTGTDWKMYHSTE